MPPDETLGDVMRQIGIYDASAQTRSPLQTALQQPRPRPMPRQMRPAEQRAMDPNAGVRRQAMGQLDRRAGADLATMPRVPRGNQFAEAGAMALEGTGLPSVRRGAETLTGVARNPSQPNAPMQALGGLGELGLGVASAATIGEFGGVRPRGRVPMREAPRMPEVPGGTPEAIERARAQGFNVETPLYHGTMRTFNEFRPSKSGTSGPGVYLTDAPHMADQYNGATRVGYRRYRSEGGNTIPVFARGRIAEPSDWEGAIERAKTQLRATRDNDPRVRNLANRFLRDEGFDGLQTRAGDTLVFDPANIRSRFDAFDAPAPQSDPEALSLARSWIDSFGGGPSAEARAIEVMTEHMQEARNPAWRQRLQDAIDSVGSRAYVQGERTSFSQRVEEAWPDIYGGAAAPDPSPPLTRPPTAVEPGPGGGGGQRVVTGQPFRTTAYRSGAGDTWFSADRRTAATYGDEVRNQPIEMRNPLVVDAQGSEYYDIPANLLPAEARGAAVGQRMRHTTTDALAEFAEANGYDGVVIQNVWDGSGARPGARTDTVYRTFESQRITRPPTQIAPNGMPIRPPQPFRNSLRGGNDDLAEAARMRDRGERL